ncbi:MAG: hypothetical protein ACYC9J_11585 [Sulfuricaulis sp.]
MPVLEVVGGKRIKPTSDTHNLIRKKAAQNGFAIGEIKTHEEHIDAIIKGLPDEVVDKLMVILDQENGNSAPAA